MFFIFLAYFRKLQRTHDHSDLIVPEIYEGVVPIALLQVHKIKDAHIISLFS